MTETLEARRAAIADKLAALRVDPGIADLVRQADDAVQNFKGEAARLEAELDAIDRAIGVRQRDQRAIAEQERQALRAAQRKQLLDKEEERLQAIADAEQAARALVDAINRTLALNAKMAKLAQALSGGEIPLALNPFDLVSRLSGRIGAVMGTIQGYRHKFGGIQWPAGASGLYPPDRSWREDEERRMAAGLQPLLEQTK